MTPADLKLWIEIYAAMGLMCAIAAIFSALRVLWLYCSDKSLRPVGWKDWLVAAPLAWWRWQKIYLTTAPVTLGIIALFGSTLPWSRTQEAPPSPARPAGHHAHATSNS